MKQWGMSRGRGRGRGRCRLKKEKSRWRTDACLSWRPCFMSWNYQRPAQRSTIVPMDVYVVYMYVQGMYCILLCCLPVAREGIRPLPVTLKKKELMGVRDRVESKVSGRGGSLVYRYIGVSVYPSLCNVQLH